MLFLAAIAKAYVWQEQLESGQFESLEDLANANKALTGATLDEYCSWPYYAGYSGIDPGPARPSPTSVCGIFVRESRYLGTSNGKSWSQRNEGVIRRIVRSEECMVCLRTL